MAADEGKPKGPDLTQGVPLADLHDGGMLAGQVREEAVLLARRGDEIFAIGAHCTHYGGPLAEGLMVGDTVRCPWHHACFALRTGEAERGPAFDPVARWRVERTGDRVMVREKIEPPAPRRLAPGSGALDRVVILGGGAAGFAAAERLRREGYQGALTVLSDDGDAPYDRPNLSKDYLAGQAEEGWMPLRLPAFYTDAGIEIRLGARAVSLNVKGRRVLLDGGGELPFDRLLMATGAEPVRPKIPGADAAEVLTLRSWADCRAIIARVEGGARRAVLVGAGFIGLEAAAALRQRGLEVTVVAPEDRPLVKVLGPQLAELIRREHESLGVAFRLGAQVAGVGAGRVALKDGTALDADLVLLGTGVKPRTALAEAAGLTVDNGIVVDDRLETSAPGVFAAGDVARWPDPHSGERIRVEHWVVAERMGQHAALAMLGRPERFDAVPFFWSRHGKALNIGMVGHATSWDDMAVEGDVAAKRAVLRYRKGGREVAVATVDRDLENLRAEAGMETRLAAAA